MPEVLAAAALLEDEGVAGARARPDVARPAVPGVARVAAGSRPVAACVAGSATHHLASLLAPAERTLPIVTVHDAASHHLAWLGGVFGQRVVPVGVDEFGQSGSIPELYGLFDLLPDQLVNAALGRPRRF